MIPRRDSLPLLAPAPSRDFPALRRVLLFTLPYRMRMAGAMLALLAASATVLGLGQGLRRLVDDGFKSGDAATLDHAVLVLIGVVVLLAGSTFCRFYLVSWIGERVVADIRRAVFDRVIALSPAYCSPDNLSRVIPEIDIWRVANLMLKRYGDEAEEESAIRAEELAADGDSVGAAVWRRVIHAIGQLVNTTPPGPMH
jgi:ABC-type multidrug transport system fused ATPase/permease subunit